MNRVVLKQKIVNPTPTEEVIAARKIVFVTGEAISWFIRKYGWSVLVSQIRSRVSASFQIKRYQVLAKGLSKSAVAIANPGLTIAKLIDKNDKNINNGWIDF